jgi:hypothetical protein
MSQAGPGTEGALAISACRSSLVFAGHYTDTPRVGQATIPRLSPTRRQTNSALRPRSQSPGRAVCGVARAVSPRTSSGSGLRSEVGGPEKSWWRAEAQASLGPVRRLSSALLCPLVRTRGLRAEITGGPPRQRLPSRLCRDGDFATKAVVRQLTVHALRLGR